MVDNSALIVEIEQAADEWERAALERILAKRQEAERCAQAKPYAPPKQNVMVQLANGDWIEDHEVALRRKSCTRCFAEGLARVSYSKSYETFCFTCKSRFTRPV